MKSGLEDNEYVNSTLSGLEKNECVNGTLMKSGQERFAWEKKGKENEDDKKKKKKESEHGNIPQGNWGSCSVSTRVVIGAP